VKEWKSGGAAYRFSISCLLSRGEGGDWVNHRGGGGRVVPCIPRTRRWELARGCEGVLRGESTRGGRGGGRVEARGGGAEHVKKENT